MKNLLNLIISVSLLSCGSTSIRMLDEENCAIQGDRFSPSGVSTGNSKQSYYNFQTGTTMVGNTQSRNLICSKSSNPYEVCLSSKLKSSGELIYGYNQGTESRELLTGFGYFLWIVPGIIGMMVNNSNNEKEMKKVKAIRLEALKACEQFKDKQI